MNRRQFSVRVGEEVGEELEYTVEKKIEEYKRISQDILGGSSPLLMGELLYTAGPCRIAR